MFFNSRSLNYNNKHVWVITSRHQTKADISQGQKKYIRDTKQESVMFRKKSAFKTPENKINSKMPGMYFKVRQEEKNQAQTCSEKNNFASHLFF
jgi:hypothetical protein